MGGGVGSFWICVVASDFRLALTGLFKRSPIINFGFSFKKFLLQDPVDFAEFHFLPLRGGAGGCEKAGLL